MDQNIPTQSNLMYIFLIVLLLGLVLSALLVWYVYFLWKRIKLNQAVSKLPGPLALPLIGSALYFLGYPLDSFTQLCRMFNHYPGLFKVWMGRTLCYCVSDPKYLAPLLAHQQVLSKMDKYRFGEPFMGLGLVTAPVDKWRNHRRIITPSFNKKNLDAFHETFVEKSNILVKVMQNHVGNFEIDISDLLSRCTLDSIIETAMGVQIDAQTTNCNFHIWLSKVLHVNAIRNFNIYYQSDVIFKNIPLGKIFHDYCNRLQLFTEKVITDKRTKYELDIQHKGEQNDKDDISKRKVFLDHLIELNYAQDKNLRFTNKDLLDETITFMVTGMETTATTMCFVLTMLGMHPDIQDKVLAELLDVIGPDRDVELSDLPHLNYLERVIKETLRLFPIVPFLARRLDEDVDLGDQVFKKGCSVVVGVLKVHRNGAYWPDPYNFDPDRFLPDEVAKRTIGCYLPFSLGPRNCIGMKYGMMSMKTILATVLRKYRTHSSYRSIKEIKLEMHMVLIPKGGFKLSLECRP